MNSQKTRVELGAIAYLSLRLKSHGFLANRRLQPLGHVSVPLLMPKRAALFKARWIAFI